MKKIIAILVLSCLTTMVFSQSYLINSKNNDFTQYNRFSATKTKVGTATLTQTKITTWDAASAKINDTIALTQAIVSLPFIKLPSLTTVEINALTGVAQFTFVGDKTLGVIKFWNGSAWKTITTN